MPASDFAQALQHYLESSLGPLQSLCPVPGGGAQGAAVWHAILASGKQIAVKKHAHAGAGEVEFGVLQMLHTLGAPAVRPLRWDPHLGVLTSEWVGQRTLAAAVSAVNLPQARKEQALHTLAQSLLRGCVALETAFAGIAERLPLRATGEPQRRQAEVRERCRSAPETYARLADHCNLAAPKGWTPALQAAWKAVADSLCDGRLTFGGRDCTPRNVLSDGAQVWFLDFAVIGLDWPEARLAQYAAAVAANTESQPLASLLTHGEERWYVESGCIDSAQLDMHHLLLWSEAARLLLDGKLGTPITQNTVLGERLRQAMQLALFPLAPKSPAEPVRSLLATVFAIELTE